MELSEIEAKADELARKMLATESKQERSHHMWALEGLHRLAQIKSTVAFRKEREESLAPMRGALPAVPGFVQCSATKFVNDWGYRCRSVAGHVPAGAHDWGGFPILPDEEPNKEPTKPAVDRLHELVSYFEQQASTEYDRLHATAEPAAEAEHRMAYGAYRDAATKLDEILREGEL